MRRGRQSGVSEVACSGDKITQCGSPVHNPLRPVVCLFQGAEGEPGGGGFSAEPSAPPFMIGQRRSTHIPHAPTGAGRGVEWPGRGRDGVGT